jgi:UDP-N-acetylglucosamine diphosphorylase/glucosamine-1-phosphate N-acetyltransferase
MVSVALFEDSHWQNFFPITLTKPTFDVKVGAKSFFEEYSPSPDFLLAREFLAATTQERHPGSKVNPSSVDADTVYVNGLLHPGAVYLDRLANISHTFAITSAGRLLVCRAGKRGGEYVANCVESGTRINLRKLDIEKTTDLGIDDSQGLLANPWDVINAIENSLSLQVSTQGASSAVPTGVKVLGDNRITIAEGAELEEGVVLDARNGGIFVGAHAHIAPCRINGPAYVGGMTQVKQFTTIESSFIGQNCRIAGEIEHSVVSDHSNKAHDGFLGHSYVGEWVNIGAMTTTSDLKMTYGNIKMDNWRDKKVDTGSNKIGSFFGDMCKTSIGTLIYSGRRIGVSSHLHGLIARDVPSFTIHASSIGSSNVELQLESAIETQRKVMSRRNIRMSKAFHEMMRRVFSMTADERKKNKVKKGKFSI